jgi:two-component system nitrogen regulation response regulator GlnG
MGATLDLSTQTLGASALAAAEAHGQTALTVLAHSIVGRVGERHVLTQWVTPVSRLEPAFGAPIGGETRPLAEASISRQPILLARLDDGGLEVRVPAELQAKVRLDGAPPGECAVLPATRLDAGVTLELSGRVALLLHRWRASPSAPTLDLVGDSEAVARLRHEIAQVADLDVPVLVRGETGSGKELVARALHAASDRRAAAFGAVNMAAVAPSLAASELFGHEKGAFSGAVRKHDGHFARAEGGTLFLDEIGDTPHDVQAMLLRVLETSEVLPVGGSRAVPVDVRIVAATDADLEEAVRAGRFRSPLLHRLAGFRIDVPPLRARRDDVGRLFYHFARLELAALGQDTLLDRDPASPWVPAALVAALARHPWPGNVRELRNVTRQLVIANRRAETLVWEPLLTRLLGAAEGARETGERPLAVAEPAPTPTPGHPRETVEPRRTYRRAAEVTEDELVEALRLHRWRFKPAAEALGLSRTALYARIESSPRLRKASDLDAAEIEAAFEAAGGDADDAAARLEVSRPALLMRATQLGLRDLSKRPG